ncbi:amino acid ABC transporter permease [Prosthecomicrobium sp. N25]|uniref:amino acid ABC transporter permease n=1 Tax=Prosthecomicrobium sp. N25 TaxID=3129254 RepID=UPI0030770BA5
MSFLADPYYRELLLAGGRMTLAISLAVIVASNLLALPLAIHMQRPGARLRRVVLAYSFFARAVPALAILFALYYGLPRLGIYLEPVPAAIVGLIFASTAYNLEFLRSGFESIPAGQADAARALGLGPVATYLKVLVPQAYAAASPALFSNAVQMVKGSSLASLVAVTELTATSTTIIADTYKAIQVLLVVAAIYGLIALVILGLQVVVESRRRLLHPKSG